MLANCGEDVAGPQGRHRGIANQPRRPGAVFQMRQVDPSVSWDLQHTNCARTAARDLTHLPSRSGLLRLTPPSLVSWRKLNHCFSRGPLQMHFQSTCLYLASVLTVTFGKDEGSIPGILEMVESLTEQTFALFTSVGTNCLSRVQPRYPLVPSRRQPQPSRPPAPCAGRKRHREQPGCR